MCETTATKGMVAPYATPEHMFEIEPGCDLTECEHRVKTRILAEHPELEFVESSRMKKTRKSRPYSSDLIFKRKKKSFLSKLGLKK